MVDAIQSIDFDYSTTSLEIDMKTNNMFVGDMKNKVIKKIRPDGSQRVILSGIAVIEGLGYDWTTDNLYFVDSGHDVIGVAAVYRHMHKILIGSNLDQPRSIVLDPERG